MVSDQGLIILKRVYLYIPSQKWDAESISNTFPYGIKIWKKTTIRKVEKTLIVDIYNSERLFEYFLAKRLRITLKKILGIDRNDPQIRLKDFFLINGIFEN